MESRRKYLQALLHSGAAVLFLAAIALYASSSLSLALGAVGIAAEAFAWLLWLGGRSTEAG